ncbi:puratrophin-1-like isoform X2 [Copidosoma floridanum]|uniref:puratrophin-1-like isoform X2 n=1 Tax=Copidosoma floridanum TaxID=29053 RepID=UPI0006C94D19|nr:puratrophin-1-like isoform X2 [Copidosoma floridanum]
MINLKQIALVWRASSMRAPGIIGWDREDELMDWREAGPQKSSPLSSTASAFSSSSSTSTTSSTQTTESTASSGSSSSWLHGELHYRPNRRAQNEQQQLKYRSRHESRSTERHGGYIGNTPRQQVDELPGNVGCDVVKSKSSSSVDAWAEEARAARERRSTSSGRCTDRDSEAQGRSSHASETRNKLKRGTRVVSPATMEKWKETSRCETRSRVLAPRDLVTPVALESMANNRVPEQTHIVKDRQLNGNAPSSEQRCFDSVSRPEEVSDLELPAYINTLLVTVERKIERVSVDDLTFPCTACRNIDTDDPLLGCKCAGDACECENEASCECQANGAGKPVEARSFEIAGIKHIDSDDEEEVRMGFGTKKRIDEVTPPRSILEISDRTLNCGLSLPGHTDVANRPVLEFDGCSSRRDVVSSREMASLIFYLSRLPSSFCCSADSTQDGFALLINANSREELDTLDRAVNLLKGKVKITQVYLLRISPEIRTTELFPRSHPKIVSLDENTIEKHIPRRTVDYNHEHCVGFYKEYDSVMTEWQAAGRRLALEMSELKECTSLSGSLTPLNRLLTDPTLRRTARDAEEAMLALEERAATLMGVEHVRLALERARRLLEEVGNAATRLESSFESRRATIRNLAVLRSIEDQAREVLSWLCKKGEDVLTKHGQHSATSLAAARLHEREFEKFYFTSMRHLDKGGDLAEAASASGLRELARSLKHHLRGFGARLEDRREYLEDTSRCCLLQDRAYEWAQEARVVGERRAQQFLAARPPLPAEHFAEMIALAEKLGNDVLLEQCKLAKAKCVEALEIARSSSAPGSPARRRSSATSDLANSWDDSLTKRASWDDSDSSGASYAGPMDGGSNSNGSGHGSAGPGNGRALLDNIAELRESAEQLLDCCSPPRTPPRSPQPQRRLVKPPVNSHLHRAPSIAPGMKAKKTILLIMREMIQTERDYVKSLEYIIENYIPELLREDIPQSLRGQRNVIFGNVEKIYEFHSQYFLNELEQCEQSPMMVGQCFLRHKKKFYLYALYNKNKPNSDSLMAEYGTAFFKAKQLELGDKMDLASYLLKPVQRMGKYALLLQQLVKAGTDLSDQLLSTAAGKSDDAKDEKDGGVEAQRPMVEGEAELRSAEEMVRFQLRHGNDLLAMDSLRDCDVNVKEQGRLLRQNEFLVWQGKGKKCLRQVFLFEDLILFSKARRFPDRKNLDIYIYKHSIKTTDIGLTAVIADSPTKFEIWFRKRKPGDTYTLQCASEEIKRAWTEELSNLLWKQALKNREVRMAEMSSMGIGNKPCLDIRPSADQINDRSISVAQLSKTPRFRNSIAVSSTEDSGRCNRRPHSVISVSSSSSSGGSSGPPTTLNLGLDTSPRLHHRSTTLNSQCSVESGIIADISIVSDDGGEGGGDRGLHHLHHHHHHHWNTSLDSPTSQLPPTGHSTPQLQSPASGATSGLASSVTSPSSSEANLAPYDQDVSVNL